MSSPPRVIATEQAGKAQFPIACSRIAKTLRKRSSCAASLRARNEKPDSEFDVKGKGCPQCSAARPGEAAFAASLLHSEMLFWAVRKKVTKRCLNHHLA